jgi:hypothetical protein
LISIADAGRVGRAIRLLGVRADRLQEVAKMSNGNYEFSEEQNKTIGSLAYSMRGVGFFYAVLGLASLAFYGYTLYRMVLGSGLEIKDAFTWNLIQNQSVQGIVSGLLFLIFGILTRSAAGHLQRVVDTRGDDVAHLMTALGRLGGAFRLLYFVIVIALAAIVILVFLPLVMGLLRSRTT